VRKRGGEEEEERRSLCGKFGNKFYKIQRAGEAVET